MSGKLKGAYDFMRDSPQDVCECGDYRRQHDNGKGRCNICSWSGPTPACTQFRKDFYATGREQEKSPSD